MEHVELTAKMFHMAACTALFNNFRATVKAFKVFYRLLNGGVALQAFIISDTRFTQFMTGCAVADAI